MKFSEVRKVEFFHGENFRLVVGTALIVGGMLGGMLAWATGKLSAGGLWPEWVTPFTIITIGLISYTAFAAELFGGAITKKTIDDNTAVLKKIEAGMKEMSAGMDVLAAGQAEIIRFLKAGVPPGAAATGVPPPAAAVGDGGNRDVRIEALGDQVKRLRAEVEALKGGTGGIPR